MSWNVHYCSAFNIRGKGTVAENWESLIRFVRNWIKYKPEKAHALDSGFFGPWFFSKGSWASTTTPQFSLYTASFGSTEFDIPRIWSVQYIHPCDHISRRWKVNISIEMQDDNIFLISTSVFNQIIPGYIGELPKSPTASVPLLIKNLIQSAYWSVFLGSEKFTVRPRTLTVGEGMEFKRRLEDPNRHSPIVLINNYQKKDKFYDTKDLAWKLAGTANVYEVTDADVDNELYHCIGRYSCRSCSIRIYMPGLNTEEASDFKRHRFFGFKTIEKIGEDNLMELIVDGLARRQPRNIKCSARSVFDIYRMEREATFERIKSEATAAEEIYINYNADVEKELDETKKSLSELQAQISSMEVEKRAELSKFHALIGRLRKDMLKYKNICTDCQKILSLKTLPSDVHSVAVNISQLFPSQLVFTDDALKSAEGAHFDDHQAVWDCLFSISTLLHKLIFSDEMTLGKAAEVFGSSTKFRISLTESSATNKDSRIIASRKIQFEGAEYDTSPHITLYKIKSYLRIHFALVTTKKQILITHCGDHLKTAGTRRMK